MGPTPRLASTHGKDSIKGKTETSVDKNKADEELKSNNAPSQKLNLSSEHTSESIHSDAHDENINDAFVYEELLKNDYSDYSDIFHATKMMKKHQNKNKNDKEISKTMRQLENEEEFLHLLKNDRNDLKPIATQKPDSITNSDTKAGSGNEKNELHSHELVTDKSISNDHENSNKNIRTNETSTPTTTTSSSTPIPRLASTNGKDAIKGKTETSVDKNKADEELKSNNAHNHITSIPERKIFNKNIDTDISKTVEKLEKQDDFLILLKNYSNDVNHNSAKKLN